jgi:hypothetical protein
MPIYYYKCPECNSTNRRLLAGEAEADKMLLLCHCTAEMVRAPQPPTARITETLDNGVMVRKLERLADAEQIHKEMSHGKKGNI